VVALPGLLQLLQVIIELALVRKAGAVDALQHLVLLAAAPVGSGDLGQLERLDLTGLLEVRPGAQVGEIALAVKRDYGVFRELVDQLDLVGFFFFQHQLPRLGTGQLEAFQGQIGLDDLLHLILDLFQIIGREGVFAVKIVIEAILDRRTDGQARLREQLFDGVRQDVRRGVAKGLAIGRICKIRHKGSSLS